MEDSDQLIVETTPGKTNVSITTTKIVTHESKVNGASITSVTSVTNGTNGINGVNGTNGINGTYGINPINGTNSTLPVVTNGNGHHHEDHLYETTLTQKTNEFIKITKIQEMKDNQNENAPLKSSARHVETKKITIQPKLDVKEEFLPPTAEIPVAKFEEGPDQVLPSDENYTVRAEGCVKVDVTGQGMASIPPISVPSLLRRTAEQYPDNTALAIKGEDGVWIKTSYREYEALVRTCAKAFIKLGLKRYRSVCILGFNSPEWFISDLGAIYAGGFAAGIYTTNSAEACFYCADSSNANIIVVQDQKQLDKILEIKDRLPELKAIIQYEGKPTVEGVISWEEMMTIGRNESDETLDRVLKTIGVNECCTLVYTSGTVGNPKAAMLSHDNLTWTGHVTAEYLSVVRGEEVIVSYLPVSHVAAQIVDFYLAITAAATVYFADNNALKGSLINTLTDARPTYILGVPRVWEKISEKMMAVGSQVTGVKKAIATWAKGVGYQHNIDLMKGENGFSLQYALANRLIFKRIRKTLGLDRCKLMISGAAPLATEIKKYFWSIDLTLVEGFGMSESSGCHTLNIPSAFRLESIGKTVPGCFTKIDNPDANYQGEILMNGRNIFMGYLNDLPKTEETFDANGWFRSGDVGTIDSEGFAYITGRIKEILITAGGENVAPVLIEDNIKEELPCISQAVVIGDHKKFLSVLLTLKTEVSQDSGEPLDELAECTKRWCRDAGCAASTVNEIVATKNERVYAAIQAGIDRANKKAISNAQRIQKFAILARDFSIGSGELGPTMKVKRNVVVKKNENIVESFYEL